jgi:hypothetical protein
MVAAHAATSAVRAVLIRNDRCSARASVVFMNSPKSIEGFAWRPLFRARLQHRGPYSEVNFRGKIIRCYPAYNETDIAAVAAIN